MSTLYKFWPETRISSLLKTETGEHNPATQQVLNPLAWAACPTNTTCTATGTLYSDFRGPRIPSENANLGHNFRIKERMNLQIRAEFVNIFNRTLLPNPIAGPVGATRSSNPQVNVTKKAGINPAGLASSIPMRRGAANPVRPWRLILRAARAR